MAGRTGTVFLPITLALLFLLVGIAAASETLRSVGPTGMTRMRSLQDEFPDECLDEVNTCASDSSCLACETAFLAKYDSCTGGGNYQCDEAQEVHCCALSDEDEDCENNTAFANYAECTFTAWNTGICDPDEMVDLSDCSGATGRALSWGVSSTASSAAIVGLLVAVFGFVW